MHTIGIIIRRTKLFDHAPCHTHRIRDKFGEISTFCGLERAEILHKDQYKAYVIVYKYYTYRCRKANCTPLLMSVARFLCDS